MKTYDKKILIFSLARSGSTTLMNLLNIHKMIYAISEPFNILNEENLVNIPGICEREISTREMLDEELGKITENYNCIKHIWHPSGFPFIESSPGYAFNDIESLNEYLLTKFDFVIFLNRRNILKRIVSVMMSKQTELWEPIRIPTGRDKKTVKTEEFSYHPVNPEGIEWHIKHEKFYVDYFREKLISRGVKYIEMFHEDFLAKQMHVKEKISIFNNLLDFLELPRNFNHDQTLVMQDYLGTKLKLNSASTYTKIPNIQEIEELFGSDETGWIFGKKEAVKNYFRKTEEKIL